jgi:hypothetical protein
MIRKYNPDGTYSSPMKVIGDVTLSDEFTADYYIACFSTRYDGRLFEAFDADSVLVINDVPKFQDRVWPAFLGKFGGDPRHVDYFVEYVDPFEQPPAGLGVTMQKHFRYAYQKEYRFAFMYPGAANRGDHFFIEAGSLADIAYIIKAEMACRLL